MRLEIKRSNGLRFAEFAVGIKSSRGTILMLLAIRPT